MTEGDVDGRHSADGSDQGGNNPSLMTKSPPSYNQSERSLHSQTSSSSAQHRPSASFSNFNFYSTNSQAPQLGPLSAKVPPVTDKSVRDAALSLQQFSAPRADDPAAKLADNAPANQSVTDEEAIVYSQTRMLQDPTGRLRAYNAMTSE
jgi:hypothetical protein